MSAYTTAYCGICGLPMVGGIGSTLRCRDDSNVAHNQWFGRPTFMLPADPRDAEITALRAALDQERATTLDLAMLVRKMERELRSVDYARADLLRMQALDYLQRKGLQGSVLRDDPTALLSGRGENTSEIIRKVLDDNRDILESMGD